MTIREAISEVRNDLKAISIDTWIPGKYIHHKLIGKAALFIKRDQDDRVMNDYTDLWTAICLDMVEDDLIKCCNISIPNCTKVMRSVQTIPAIYTSRYGYLATLTAANYVKDYNPTTPQQYKYIKSREFQDRTKGYFWIDRGRIVVPDSMADQVTLNAMFINRADALRIDCNTKDSCIRFLDENFIAPPHLWNNIKNAAVLELAQVYEKIQPDELANLNANERDSTAGR